MLCFPRTRAIFSAAPVRWRCSDTLNKLTQLQPRVSSTLWTPTIRAGPAHKRLDVICVSQTIAAQNVVRRLRRRLHLLALLLLLLLLPFPACNNPYGP
jgi:hypothetical protein